MSESSSKIIYAIQLSAWFFIDILTLKNEYSHTLITCRLVTIKSNQME